METINQTLSERAIDFYINSLPCNFKDTKMFNNLNDDIDDQIIKKGFTIENLAKRYARNYKEHTQELIDYINYYISKKY